MATSPPSTRSLPSSARRRRTRSSWAATSRRGRCPARRSGHTHRQLDRTADGRRMINAGSVGRPYEHEPGAYWLRLGPGAELRRTAYDTRAATAAFRALGYPEAGDMLAPVDPDEVAAGFEAGAGAAPAPGAMIWRYGVGHGPGA